MRSLIVVATLASASFAYAAPIQYSSQSAFNAAATTTTYTVPAPAGGPTFQQVSDPYTIAPITFTDTFPVTYSGFFLESDGAYGSGQTYFDDLAGASEKLAFAPTTAIGFLIGTYDSAATITFTLSGNTYMTTTSASKTPTFVGFTSSSAFSSITIADTDSETDILKFQVGSANGTPTVTPEPSGIVLLGTGIAGVAGMLRRRIWRSRT